MTAVQNQPSAPGPAPGGRRPWKSPPQAGHRAPKRGYVPKPPPAKKPAPSGTATVVSSTLLTFALVCLAFVLYLAAFSGLKHAREQHLAYADFRKQLALGTAPTGPTRLVDPNSEACLTDASRTDCAKELLPLGTAVAIIEIPDIAMNEVVFEGTTGEVLAAGPGHLRTSVLPGQMGSSVLYGRQTSYGGPFADIDKLEVKSRIIVTTGQGRSTYQVIDVRRAGDPVPPAVAAGGGRLTLTTAIGPPLFPDGTVRVDADLVGAAKPTPTQVLTPAGLSAAERALATDPGAWMPLVLWGQGLVIVTVLVALARLRWGRQQAWVIGIPVVLFFAFGVASTASRLLPNLT